MSRARLEWAASRIGSSRQHTTRAQSAWTKGAHMARIGRRRLWRSRLSVRRRRSNKGDKAKGAQKRMMMMMRRVNQSTTPCFPHQRRRKDILCNGKQSHDQQHAHNRIICGDHDIVVALVVLGGRRLVLENRHGVEDEVEGHAWSREQTSKQRVRRNKIHAFYGIGLLSSHVNSREVGRHTG